MPLVIALTTVAWAGGPEVVLTEAVQHRGSLVSLEATNVTLAELAERLSLVLGSEVRIEGFGAGRVTVNVKEVPVVTLLSQTAAVLGSRWQITYQLSTHDATVAAPPAPSGVVLNLKMVSVSCQAAASVVARMAGGRAERDGELLGQVTLQGDTVPVEEAMDAIARAAGASWRRLYVMKVDALPQVITQRQADPNASRSGETKPSDKHKPRTGLFSMHATSADGPTKLAKRDRLKPGQHTYMKGVKSIPPTEDQIRKQAMMGLYGPLFLVEAEADRQTMMGNFRAGLETQIKRLEALPPSQRSISTSLTRRNFQRLIDDFVFLDKDQKKEAQALYDYAREQLTKPPLKD